jgi:hypothetical protein
VKIVALQLLARLSPNSFETPIGNWELGIGS